MTLRRTASLARILWYGSLAVGAILGGGISLVVALHVTQPKESA